jgi:Holliday junction resolvase RusA-like endonuclease
MKPIYLKIPKEILSLNKLNQMHWSKKHKYSKEWEGEIFAAYYEQSRFTVKHANQKRWVRIFSFRKRKLDQDNLVGGCKGLMDALKRLGLIVDDSPKWVEVRYEQLVPAVSRLTVIEIFEEKE